MGDTAVRSLWLLTVSLAGLVTMCWIRTGEAAEPAKHTIHLPTDWSHRHLIFSRPGTAAQAARVSEDLRYWQQVYRRELSLMLPAGEVDVSAEALYLKTSRWESKKFNRDWSEELGAGASAGAGNYPAKFSFDITTAKCGDAATPDYVVYSTGLAGTSTQASVVAYDNLYAGCSKLNLGTAANFAVLGSSTVTNTGNTVVTGANIGISPGTSLTGFPPGVLTAPAVKHLGDPVASQAQADANTAFTALKGLTGATPIASLDGQTLAPGLYKSSAAALALSAGATVTLSGDGTYIFQVGSTLTLAGTVILSGGALAGNVIWLVGSSATLNGTTIAVGDIIAQASITLNTGAALAGRVIALAGAVTMDDNAITTVDTVPSVYWAYNTGGQVLTSPVLSLDGSQLGFVETNGGFGILVLLKWSATAGTVNLPATPTLVDGDSYATCAPPCMTQILLRDGLGIQTDDTTSSVYYDYSNDVAWVGGTRGWLHKITGVFKGVPTEVTHLTGAFPVQVNTGNTLSSPVYDGGSKRVFVGDAGGFLYRVDAVTGAVTASGKLDFGTGVVEGPVLDSTNHFVFVFASSDGSSVCTGGVACSAVYQLTTTFGGGTTGSKVTVGNSVANGSTPNPMYIGGFDSTYYDSIIPTAATGNLYVCGNTGAAPTLYQVPIAAGVLPASGLVIAQLATSAFTAGCSPVADVPNPNVLGAGIPSERLFVSVQNHGLASACAPGGCVFNFVNTPWKPFRSYAVGQQVLSSRQRIETVMTPGISASAPPNWSTQRGNTDTDGQVVWINQGLYSASTLPVWIPSHIYNTFKIRILDGNNNVEIETTPGTSGTETPTWNTAPGGMTIDGSVTWTNVGAIATAALPTAGGTSGIIVDNTVGSFTLVGGSQIYFSTLSDGVCGKSGTGGCAVQASQPGLQ